MTEKIRRRPYAVVLLDEIEKAHPDVYNTLLQIMEEGRLTDSFGRNVDFKNTIIIMTTNAGAEVTSYTNIFGFDRGRDEAGSYEQMKERLKVAIEKYFRPEFLNRLDDVIVFHALNKEDLKQIVDIELAKIRGRMSERGHGASLDRRGQGFLDPEGLQPRLRGTSTPPSDRKSDRKSAQPRRFCETRSKARTSWTWKSKGRPKARKLKFVASAKQRARGKPRRRWQRQGVAGTGRQE